MVEHPFWLHTPEANANRLSVGLSGLTSAEAAARRFDYGPNSDPEGAQTGPIKLIVRRVLEPMSLLLVFAAVIAALTGDAPSALIILAILSASITLDLVQEGRAKREADALRQSVAVAARVKRDGVFTSIAVEDLVPGDIFEIDVGDIVPADGILLTSSALTVDEAALTGEPYGVVKMPGTVTSEEITDASNAVFRGSVVMTGTAVPVITTEPRKTAFDASVISSDVTVPGILTTP